MDNSRPSREQPEGFRPALESVFQKSVRRQMLAYLVAFILVDLAVLAVCPAFGGDCLYGLFTLIAYPVMLSGVLGVLLPRIGLRYRKRWGARLTIIAMGALLLGLIVVAAHMVAVGVLNAPSYGGVLVRTRLLSVELALAMTYYVLLSVIVFAKADDGSE